MRIVYAVLLPFLLQLVFAAVMIFVTNGSGSFVGLGVMVLGLYAIPFTALVNWLSARKKVALPARQLARRTIVVTALYPAAMFALYALEKWS